MNDQRKVTIIPETELERAIITSPIFEIATAFYLGDHRQKTVLAHIRDILSFMDKQPWEHYRQDLRLLALLHDLGKHRVTRNQEGHIVGEAHSVISEQIAKEFVQDQRLLYAIRIHDKYFGFYKDFSRGHFNESKFVRTFAQADLDILRRFNYADSSDREKGSIVWFENTAHNLHLTRDKVYQINPSVLLSQQVSKEN